MITNRGYHLIFSQGKSQFLLSLYSPQNLFYFCYFFQLQLDQNQFNNFYNIFLSNRGEFVNKLE